MTNRFLNNLVPKLLLFVCCFLQISDVRAQQPKLMLPIGHTGSVNTVNFSSNGKLIVTASDDNTAKVWDAQTGTLLAELKGHASYVASAYFSPDCQKIVTASGDNTAKIWDAVSGALLVNITGHNGDVIGANFSPDSKKIITVSVDGTAKIWNAQSGALLFDLKHNNSVASACFSPNGKKVVTASYDSTAKIWDAVSGRVLFVLKGHAGRVNSACFSPDGKELATSSWDSTAKIWDVVNGRLLFVLKGHQAKVNSSCFSPNGKEIVTASGDHTAKVWNTQTGTLLADLKGYSTSVNSAYFSPDGKMIVTASGDKITKIWDAQSGVLIDSLKGHTRFVNNVCFSPDGKKIATASGDLTAKIWDSQSRALLIDLRGRTHEIKAACFSPDSTKVLIVTASWDSTAKIWDGASGTLTVLRGHTGRVNSACFSPDGKKIVTASWDRTAKIWDAMSGAVIADLKGHTSGIASACFSADGKKIVTASRDSTAKIWSVQSGKLLYTLKGHNRAVTSARFSPDGKKIVTSSWDNTAKIWDAQNGKLLDSLEGHTHPVNSACFSPDGRMIVTASSDSTAKIWDAGSGKLLAQLKGHTNIVQTACFSPDSRMVITASCDRTAKIWDAQTGRLLGSLEGHNNWVNTAYFSSDGKKIVTASADNTAKIWDAGKRSLLYTFFILDSTDYLVVDKDNQYDGTPAGRKLLYYTCGTEVIELQQLKDKLWVPDLVERINNGETINASVLSDLGICGLTPLVEQIENKTGYQFKITVRKGGLGQTALYVNGIETRKYTPSALKKVAGGYTLIAEKDDLKQYFIPGAKNVVSVKAYTKENDIFSRGVTVSGDTVVKDNIPPNLYAVVIGVSKYKGDDLDLQYAAKDAGDFSNAVSLSAGKMLGSDHVFMYDLTTDKEHYLLPEKKSIERVFAEIGKKATANDILLIFFAGHGVVEGEKKQFYFLTADASASSITPTGVRDVGVSADELMDWMKPATIRAQKRILILDACQSGMAIDKILSIGRNQGYLAVRSDDKAEQIKQIDKLNEKAGLYILAASASDQSAYEIGRYSQGLLTYALLKVIKEHPEVLEQNKFLNVSGWFNEAVKIVEDIVREANLRQEPQLITTTNFNIGVVDGDVLARIVLPNEKVLFGGSNFQNTDSVVAYDDLLIGRAVNSQLNEVATRGTGEAITCLSTTDSPDAYIISGRYQVNGDEILVKVNLRQSKEPLPKYSFDVIGNKDDMKALVENIVQKAMEWIGNKK